MVFRYYSIRRRKLNDAQLLQVASAVNDVAQVVFAVFFIPLFFGETSIFGAFFGVCMASVLWFLSVFLLRACGN